MAATFSLGIDPAKRNFTACLLSPQGALAMAPRDFPSGREGYDALAAELRRAVPAGARLFAGVEASASLDDNLLAALPSLAPHAATTVLRLEATQVREHRAGPRPRRGKTDRTDARRAAEFVRAHAEALDRFEADAEADAALALANERAALAADITALENRLRDLLIPSFPEFEAVFSDPCGATALAVLRRAPTARHAARMRASTLAAIRGAKGTHKVGDERAAALLAHARRSIASATTDTHAGRVRRLVERIQHARQQLAEIEDAIGAYASGAPQQQEQPAQADAPATDPREQIRLLRTIPGFGTVNAAATVLRSRGLARFASAKAFAAQLALCPVRDQTGDSRDSGRLEQRGDRRTRPLLFLAALSASTCDPAMAFFKWRIQKAGKTGRQATIALAHKLAIIAWNLVRNRTPYDPARAIRAARSHNPELWKQFLEEHPKLAKKAALTCPEPALT